MTSKHAMRPKDVTYRPPTLEDGQSIWRLAHDSRVLDVNSPYCYLLLCKHFSQTCLVVEANGALVGFVTAFLPPRRDDTLFIWQIGVASAWRGKGMGTRLLRELLQRDVCRGVNFLEATVGPANQASRALFAALAQTLKSALSERPYFDAALFPRGSHDAENLVRIGPFAHSDDET